MGILVASGEPEKALVWPEAWPSQHLTTNGFPLYSFFLFFFFSFPFLAALGHVARDQIQAALVTSAAAAAVPDRLTHSARLGNQTCVLVLQKCC